MKPKQIKCPPYFIIKSSDNGLGVFAIAEIRKGTLLFKMTGIIRHDPTRTSVQVGKHKHIEDQLAAYVNHNCHPTAKIAKRGKAMMSLRDVHKGDEITFDYNRNEDQLATPFKCGCCGKKICGRKNKKNR